MLFTHLLCLCHVPWECCFLEGGICCLDQTILQGLEHSRLWTSSGLVQPSTPRTQSTNTCIRLCNTVRRLTRRYRNLHVAQITKDLHQDHKPFWCWLKNTKGGHHTIPDLHFQGNILTTAIEKARAFNQFFSSVFTKVTSINICNLHLKLPSRSIVEIKNVLFNPDDVHNLLCTRPYKIVWSRQHPWKTSQGGSTMDC